MEPTWSDEARLFRQRVQGWLHEHLEQGPFSALRGRGGLGDMDALIDERRAWERHLAAHGWTCLSWPRAWGGQDCTLEQEILFQEAYAQAHGPGRVGHIGEGLLGPTLLRFGTDTQKHRFLPRIADATELWCQGYSEPEAGSDLAGVRTRATLLNGQWVIEGQKVWTSLAGSSEWCFVLARTEIGSQRHHGLSCLLVDLRQPGVRAVPIRQMTGNAEFYELFFDGATTPADHVLGTPGEGWKVAMYTLSVERGASTLAQNLAFQQELDTIIEAARRNGRHRDPRLRDRIAGTWMRVQTMRHNALRAITSTEAGHGGREALIPKLFWANLHRDMGELAMDVLGDEALTADGPLRRLFLWSRADTIYAGTNEIQRNLIATRGLGLPR